jgi:putative MFS transporter
MKTTAPLARAGALGPDRAVARGTLHGRIAVVAGLAFAANGLNLGVLSSALLGLRSAWGITTAQASLLTMAAGAGQLVGGIAMGHAADRIGRRRGYGITVALSSLPTGAAAFAPSFGWLAALVFLGGCGFGGVAPVGTSLVAEFAPPSQRGALMGWTQVMWVLGWLVAAAAGALPAHALGWRGVFAVGILPIALAIVGPRLVPESPRFLLAHGRRHDAETLAARLRARFAARIDLPDQEQAARASMLSHLRELWGPRFRRRTMLLWGIWFVMIGAFNGPALWLPVLMGASGMRGAADASLAVGLAALPLTLATTLLVDRLGRKPIMIAALLIAVAATAGMAVARGGATFMLSGAALGAATLGSWPVILSYAAELYPTRVRATATGWASAAGRSAGILSPAMLAMLMPTWAGGRTSAMSVFAAALGVAVLIVLLLGEETAGRPLEEVTGVCENGARGSCVSRT